MLRNIIKHFLAISIAISVMIILLISSIEFVTYYIPHYYEHEYERYGVDEQLSIDMPVLMEVTHDMLDYLRGRHDSLEDISISIGGEKVPFFNEKEVLHMEDVRGLFLSGILLRRILLIYIFITIGILYFMHIDVPSLLSDSIMRVALAIFCSMILLVAIVATDFTRYFILFHKIFFANDLWLLDPATDRLICLVPEGFFIDTARNIGICYLLSMLIIMAVAYHGNYSAKQKNIKI